MSNTAAPVEGTSPGRAVGYARVSTAFQAEEGRSLEAQEVAIRRYAALRGFEIVDLCVDGGVSGTLPLEERAAGRRALDQLGPETPHLIAVKLDRLFRSSADMHVRINAWNDAGFTLHLVDQGGTSFDTRSPLGRFFLTILAGVAELERAMIMERTAQVRAIKRANGEHLSGSFPFGYKTEPGSKVLVEDPGEQATIAYIGKLSAMGLSQRAIVARLQAEKVPGRGAWSKTVVQRILSRLTDSST